MSGARPAAGRFVHVRLGGVRPGHLRMATSRTLLDGRILQPRRRRIRDLSEPPRARRRAVTLHASAGARDLRVRGLAGGAQRRVASLAPRTRIGVAERPCLRSVLHPRKRWDVAAPSARTVLALAVW